MLERFSGRKLQGTKTTDVKVLDFADGDTLIFANYDRGTFEGGDESGTYAAIDTLDGLRALDEASDAVSIAADAESDVLTIEIDQGAATHRRAIADMAQDYLSF